MASICLAVSSSFLNAIGTNSETGCASLHSSMLKLPPCEKASQASLRIDAANSSTFDAAINSSDVTCFKVLPFVDGCVRTPIVNRSCRATKPRPTLRFTSLSAVRGFSPWPLVAGGIFY